VVRSPENTNNVLTAALALAQKRRVRSTCLEIVGDYNYQPNSIIKYLD